jgi:rusticyanin
MKLLLATIVAVLFTVSIFAKGGFTLVSSKSLTLNETQLQAAEKEATAGKKEGTNISFSQTDIRLVIVTGPEDDMLSYRILGVRNPTLVIPTGATLRILFVNQDSDMRHDIRLGKVIGDFALSPELAQTAGSPRLEPHDEGEPMQAAEIVLKASEKGEYKYFCTLAGHAKGGMWGNVLVGVKPSADLKSPIKP